MKHSDKNPKEEAVENAEKRLIDAEDAGTESSAHGSGVMLPYFADVPRVEQLLIFADCTSGYGCVL